VGDEKIPYGVLGAEGYFKVGSSEDVSNVRSFLADVCEGSPYLGGCRFV
jgi:hypothetical protein